MKLEKKIISFGLIVCFIAITSAISAQSATYFYGGWSIEKFNNTDPLNLIVNDFNTYYQSNGRTLSKKLETPGLFNGLILGLKLDNEAVTMGIDLHAHSFSSISEGTYSSGSSFIKRMKVAHHGFTLAGGWNAVHAEGFRMGPVLCFNFEQFKVKLTHSKKLIEPNIDIATDIFYFSPSLKFPLSFGKESFTFDIIPYYQLPIYKMNLTKLNNMLNDGYATAYSKNQMKLSPASLGCYVTLNFALGN